VPARGFHPVPISGDFAYRNRFVPISNIASRPEKS